MQQDINTLPVWYEDEPDDLIYRPLKKEVAADVVVIGGGIVGLMSAWYLVESGFSVVLLEKGLLANGDTGATTGFLTRPLDTSLIALKKLHGEKFVTDLALELYGAQKELFKIIADNKIRCDFLSNQSYWISYTKKDPGLLKEWDLVRTVDKNTSLVEGKNGDVFASAIRYDKEGRFHPRKFISALASLLAKKGVLLFEESGVVSVAGNEVRTAKGKVVAKHIVVATGKPDDTLFPELSSLVVPRLTYVLAAQYHTQPIGAEQYWDVDHPYFYFRMINPHTLILGGADISYDKIKSQDAYTTLTPYLDAHVPGYTAITNFWSGSLYVTPDEVPYVFTHPHVPNVHVITGFGGQGLVFSALAGKTIAYLIAGKNSKVSSILNPQRNNISISHNTTTMNSSTSSKGTHWVAVAKVSEFTKENKRCITVGDKKLALFTVDNIYVAMDNACSHMGGPLCDGDFDGKTITCPWHGSKFSITDGKVVTGPAKYSQKIYTVRIVGDSIEVGIEDGEVNNSPSNLPAPPVRYTKLILTVLGAGILFWAVQFCLQFFYLVPGNLASSLIRSFALTGATMIGAALLMSIVFKFIPALADHWRVRRYTGVVGVLFITLHALSVYALMYGWDFATVYWSLNPLKNPVVFGSLALTGFMIMALTSSDWMVAKLTYPRWKLIHRVAYFAWMSAIFHFVLVNPLLRHTLPIYLLFTVATLVVVGQLYWWIRIAGRKKFMTWGGLLGAVVILSYLALGYLAFFAH
ncbi:MAG: FAD-dependent oxidoreductase [Patescibacteria group bacterium]